MWFLLKTILLVSSKSRATSEDTGAEHLSERWTQKLKRDEGLCYEHCYDGSFLSMRAWERTQRPQRNEVCFKSEWETEGMKKSHWARSFDGFFSFSCTGNAAKISFNHKVIGKVMLRSQSHSLLPFSLKLLKQGKQDAQISFSFLCLASAERKKKNVLHSWHHFILSLEAMLHKSYYLYRFVNLLILSELV